MHFIALKCKMHIMENTYTYPSGQLLINETVYSIVDLPAIFGDRMQKLPLVLRLLLENVVRNMQGSERLAAVTAIFNWLNEGTSEAELAFQPGRVLMHDTTSTPAWFYER